MIWAIALLLTVNVIQFNWNKKLNKDIIQKRDAIVTLWKTLADNRLKFLDTVWIIEKYTVEGNEWIDWIIQDMLDLEQVMVKYCTVSNVKYNIYDYEYNKIVDSFQNNMAKVNKFKELLK